MPFDDGVPNIHRNNLSSNLKTKEGVVMVKKKDLNWTVAISAICLMSVIFYYVKGGESDKKIVEPNVTKIVFTDQSPKTEVQGCNSSKALKKAQCIAQEKVKIWKKQNEIVDTIYKFRRYLRSPGLFENSQFSCSELRDKYVLVAAKIYDMPSEGAVVNSKNKDLVFNFRHPYFNLPGNKKFPEIFSRQSKIDELNAFIKAKDFSAGSVIFSDDNRSDLELIFELGMAQNLFQRVVYLFEDFMHQVPLKSESICKS